MMPAVREQLPARNSLPAPARARPAQADPVPVDDEVTEQFQAGVRTEEVAFVLNDKVRVIAGPHSKRTGAVIAVATTEPVTTFMVEPHEAPWGDIQVAQTQLEKLE